MGSVGEAAGAPGGYSATVARVLARPWQYESKGRSVSEAAFASMYQAFALRLDVCAGDVPVPVERSGVPVPATRVGAGPVHVAVHVEEVDAPVVVTAVAVRVVGPAAAQRSVDSGQSSPHIAP